MPEVEIKPISPLPNIEPHRHTGLDSLKVKSDDLEGAYDGSTAVKLTGDQTVAGIKTFSSIPVLPASNPTTDNQAARKAYVDSLLSFSYTIGASSNIVDSADTERTSNVTAWTKKKEIRFNEVSGTITVSYDAKDDTGGSATFAKVYINGVAAGTEITNTTSYVTTTQNFNVSNGDLIQVYLYSSSSSYTAYVKNFKLEYAKFLTPIPGTVNQD